MCGLFSIEVKWKHIFDKLSVKYEAKYEARNSKFETNQKHKLRNMKHFDHSDFIFRACFVFRISHFGFEFGGQYYFLPTFWC